MRRRIPLLAVLACVFETAGYGFEDVEGAWAYAEDPGKAVVVVTNRTVWSCTDGKWSPTFRVSPEERGVRFRSQISEAGKSKLLAHPSSWQIKNGGGTGLELIADDVILADWIYEGRRIETTNIRRMVRAEMPDFGKIFDLSAYVGYWKPVKLTKMRGRVEVQTGPEVENGRYLKIRDDLRLVLWRCRHKPSKYDPEPGIVKRLIRTENWLREDGREGGKENEDPFRGAPRACWIDAEGHLLYFNGSDEVVEFVRADKLFEDPLEVREKMMVEGKLNGVWGVSSEYNIFCLAFDESGKGVLTGFMAAIPFDWKICDGEIRCFLDAEMLEMFSGECETLPQTLRCRYECDVNGMTVLNVKDPNNGRSRQIGYMGCESQVNALIGNIEKMKRNPQWKRQLEQVRARRTKPVEK